MRVLMLNTQMEAGGAQKAMLELARSLEQQGHRVLVATMYDKADYVPLFQRDYGLQIVDLEMKPVAVSNPWLQVWRFVLGLARLYGLIRDYHPQVVQTFSHYSNILGPTIAWLAQVPVRVSSQRLSLRDSPSWLLWLDRCVANSFLVHKMVAVSEGTRQFSIQEEGIASGKLVTIHNGVDVGRFSVKLPTHAQEDIREELGLQPGSLVVLTVARLHRQKGHTHLIRAIPSIVRDFPQARFMFVGEGGLAEQLKQEINQAQLADYVSFLGVRQDIPQLLAISHLFVLPSLWEGLPNSVLEAMAAGVPVIATDVDGNAEIIDDGTTGLLVPPGDPVVLEQAIRCLLDDDSLRTSIARAAKDRVEWHFSRAANTASFVDLYRRLIAQSAGAT